MRKCAISGEDFHLSLLDYRNTPTEGLQTSPMQRLNGRNARTRLPATEQQLTKRCDTAHT